MPSLWEREKGREQRVRHAGHPSLQPQHGDTHLLMYSPVRMIPHVWHLKQLTCHCFSRASRDWPCLISSLQPAQSGGTEEWRERGVQDHQRSLAGGSAVWQEHSHLLARTEAPRHLTWHTPHTRRKALPQLTPFSRGCCYYEHPAPDTTPGAASQGSFLSELCTSACSQQRSQEETLLLELGSLRHHWHAATLAKHPPQRQVSLPGQ